MSLHEVIGVIHLPRLPSTAFKINDDLEGILNRALNEAVILENLGYDGVIIENYGDMPYKKREDDPLKLSFLTVITRTIVTKTRFKIGLNVLRNSGREAYAIAVATGAKFIRVNALVETIVSDSGIIEPEAPYLSDLIYNYPGIEIYADVLVKHAGDLYLMSILGKQRFYEDVSPGAIIRDVIEDIVNRGKAKKIVVTGLRTGDPPDLNYIKLVKRHSPVPVIIGSGITPDNFMLYSDYADGFIVGSYIKIEGKAGNPLDFNRANKLIQAIKRK